MRDKIGDTTGGRPQVEIPRDGLRFWRMDLTGLTRGKPTPGNDGRSCSTFWIIKADSSRSCRSYSRNENIQIAEKWRKITKKKKIMENPPINPPIKIISVL